ncbi:MAG: hypothetical protein ACI82S_002122 [Patiriisocius sp.]|jgi:hypothetical protein
MSESKHVPAQLLNKFLLENRAYLVITIVNGVVSKLIVLAIFLISIKLVSLFYGGDDASGIGSEVDILRLSGIALSVFLGFISAALLDYCFLKQRVVLSVRSTRFCRALLSMDDQPPTPLEFSRISSAVRLLIVDWVLIRTFSLVGLVAVVGLGIVNIVLSMVLLSLMVGLLGLFWYVFGSSNSTIDSKLINVFYDAQVVKSFKGDLSDEDQRLVGKNQQAFSQQLAFVGSNFVLGSLIAALVLLSPLGLMREVGLFEVVVLVYATRFAVNNFRNAGQAYLKYKDRLGILSDQLGS